MVKPRAVETDQGMPEKYKVEKCDSLQRRLRDKGWIGTNMVLDTGIKDGLALEIRSGPGFLGLEWLKRTKDTYLKGLEILPEMIKVAERNAREYGVESRVKYFQGNVHEMPFDDEAFDAVFSNGALHEWSYPVKVFNEVWRVLRTGGRYCISDLRRDMNALVRWFLRLNAGRSAVRIGLESLINASYTVQEIRPILGMSYLWGYKVKKSSLGLAVTGQKKQ